MAFDPSDYDGVCEMTSASEKTMLLRQGRKMFEPHRRLRDTEGASDSLPEKRGIIDVESILAQADTPKRSECLGQS